MTTLKEFDAMLARADWHYQYSDDPTAYRAGRDGIERLARISEQSPEHLSLMRAHSACAYSPIPQEQARVIRDATRRELGVLE